jgi:Domain of unknown function (DUF4276)
MKIGLILECGPNGPDQQVCEYLINWLRPNAKVVSRTLQNKKNLVSRCGETAALLLNDDCHHVVIVWDLYPPPHDSRQNPCRFEDRKGILGSLKQAGVTSENVHLVCIREELEAWLIADNRAVEGAMSRLTHRKVRRVPQVSNPELVRNPKERLMSIFEQRKLRPYQDYIHAIRIVRELKSLGLNRIKRSESFVRFASKAAGVKL